MHLGPARLLAFCGIPIVLLAAPARGQGVAHVSQQTVVCIAAIAAARAARCPDYDTASQTGSVLNPEQTCGGTLSRQPTMCARSSHVPCRRADSGDWTRAYK